LSHDSDQFDGQVASSYKFVESIAHVPWERALRQGDLPLGKQVVAWHPDCSSGQSWVRCQASVLALLPFCSSH